MIAKTIAVVDPYSSGKRLAPAFAERGYKCIAVQSAQTIPPLFRASFRPEDFESIVLHQGDLEKTAAALKRRGVGCILPGCDLGVELADALSERLGPASNDTRLREARRDKFLMTEAVRAYGLRTASQGRARQLDELMEWVRNHHVWPIIVKPLKSAASDEVHLCRSEAEAAKAYHRIQGRRNALGLVNTAVLAQEFLQGTEYVVDTVSYAGRHRIAAFWKYHKPACTSEFVCYDAMELLPYTGETQNRLFAYTRDTLDALGLRYGPAHCELMWTEGGPTLIEMNARLSAGNNPILSRLCGGPCALDLTIEACLNPEQFLEEKKQAHDFTKSAMNCFLMPMRTGRLKALGRLAEIRRLPSFHAMSIGAKFGEPTPRVVGVVTLIHPSREILTCDLQRIRHLEKHGMYEFET